MIFLAQYCRRLTLLVKGYWCLPVIDDNSSGNGMLTAA